ncbi:MAG: ankyrin repeat domain-containing protein, partial [Pseudomonadota bacterium]
MNQAGTPYPRMGECIRALVGALDLKFSDRDVDRLAREGDFDWEKIDKVVQVLLLDGVTRIVGADAETLIKPWVLALRESYCSLVLGVPLDGLGRVQSLPVLVEDFFVPSAATLLRSIHKHRNGPELGHLLDANHPPAGVVLSWLDELVGERVDKLVYPGTTGTDRAYRDKLLKWRSGVDLPSSQSIQLFVDGLRKLAGNDLAVSAGLWLLVALALGSFDRAWSQPVRPLLAQRIAGEGTSRDPSVKLADLVRQAGAAHPELALRGSKIWHDLRRTSAKADGDQSRIWTEIEQLQSLADACDPDGRTAYHYEWMKARWNVLSGQYEEALAHFERAFELACYRAGQQLKEIVQEASCIAAFLGPGAKPALKRFKHVGIALGLFQKPQDAPVIEDWEVEHLSRQLPRLFPPQGRFCECPRELSNYPLAGLLVVSDKTIAAIQPDLKKVDRVKAIHFEGGEVRRWPQLRLFASFGRYAEVKQLMAAGAPVDQLDSADGSALLCALQYATQTGDRRVLETLLKVPHQPETLNASTVRKRLTPLMCAIDLGDPTVVGELLAQKADPNKRGHTDEQTPLYYAVSLLYRTVYPNRMYAQLVEHFLKVPDLVQQETLRRYGVDSAGVFGDRPQMQRRFPQLVAQLVSAMVDDHVRRHGVNRLRRTIEVLLEFAANPNAAHGYPVPGRTPLMLAAESDLPEVFDLMVRHGGEPMQPDASGQNCMHIALA